MIKKISLGLGSLFFLLSSSAFASSVKLSGSSGVSDYRDYGVTANWSLAKKKAAAKAKTKAALDDETPAEKGASILTSVQSTKSSGSVTNEFKVGYESSFSDVTSYDLKGYYRLEPSDVKVIGLEPSLGFDYDGLVFEDLSTSFSLGFEFARSSTDLQVTPKKTVSQSFTTAGISLGVDQEVFEGFKASLSASFYRYTEPQTRFPTPKRRLINIAPLSESALSSSGYPEKTFSFGLSWDWAEKWSSNYSISSTKTHFEGTTSIYSAVGTDYAISKSWSVGVGYAWSSSGSSTGSLDGTFSW